jgi:hypothetical protein
LSRISLRQIGDTELESVTSAVETNGGPIKKANDLPSRSDTVAKSLHQPLHLDADFPRLADALRDLLDADQRRRLVVELLRE